jgi:formylglycine-generating enzyme required for sulfatase activity
VEYPSCTNHFGGDTCGDGETADPNAKHESCCTLVTNSAGLKIGKYQVTAGRMRAFVERYNGNLQQWAASNPKGWDPSWTSELPSSLDDANSKLGPALKRGCDIANEGARTYWQPPISADEKNDFPKDVLDEKALNCVTWHMAQALCVSDGGRLPSLAESNAIWSNDGANSYPWEFQDSSGYNPDTGWDERLVHNYSYQTPNIPSDARIDGDVPLDRSYSIGPPGRRPKGANKIGVQDAVGNMLPWLNDGPNVFAWTLSWEEHPLQDSSDTWPDNLKDVDGFGTQEARDGVRTGYYAIGARCVFDK